jgi:predicted nucleotidyltransferase
VRVHYPRFSRAELVRKITARLPRLNGRLPLGLVVLFGSYAKGRHTAASDVDLLVVYKGGPRDEAYALVREELASPRLEPHLYAESEYGEMRDTIARMVAGGLVLFDGRAKEQASG